MERLASACDNFGLDLYRICWNKNKDGNIFFSPFSISAALAMILEGAKGDTAEQLWHTLYIAGMKEPDIEKEYRAYLNLIKSPGPNIILDIANNLFVQKDYHIHPEFKEVLQKYYSADAKEVDFGAHHEEVRQEINKWVAGATEEKIKELFSPGVIGSVTHMVVANAAYLKGNWGFVFDPKETKKVPFHLSETETVDVDMMYKKGEFRYSICPELKCTALELPYIGDKLAMVILLPNEVDGLLYLEEEISVLSLGMIFGRMMNEEEVCVSLPKFKLEESLSLAEIAREMGAKDLFSKNADLSGISDKNDLHVDAMIHKAYFEIAEGGQEPTGKPLPMFRYTPEIDFVVNRPFIFLIRDLKYGIVLFLGSIKKPF